MRLRERTFTARSNGSLRRQATNFPSTNPTMRPAISGKCLNGLRCVSLLIPMIRSMPGCGQACRWKQEWTPGAARSQGRFDETIATVDVAARHACRLRAVQAPFPAGRHNHATSGLADRSEEHTSELQSLMRISYAVFCLK